MKGKTIGIDEQADHLRSARIQYNRDVLGSIIKTIILAGRQNLPLRGHRDDSKYFLSSNPGNFQAFLNFRVDVGDAKLEKHFENASKNATYRSKTIQNKLIKICGEQIKEKIVSDINSSECPIYSVLGDEATNCSSIEQMPIVVRYVDSKQEINERFIKFVECEGMTGEALAKNIEDTLNEVGLLLSNCRGQCYDGASAMSSKSKGVTGRILKKNPKALYIHCASHRLNLVVTKACGEQTVKNMLGHAQKIFSFFSPSPLRMQCLRQNMEKSGLRRKKLGAPSTTRWVERIRTLDGFVEAFVPVCQSLEYMKLNMNKDFDNSITIKILRSSADTIHDQYYEEAVDLANRTTRENYPAHTAREYYRMKLTIPLLDHLIEQMEFRFSSEDVNWKEEFMKFAVAYKEDMPHFRKIHAELGLWETNWKGGFEKVKYDSIADTLRTCNKLAFPNIFTALKILAVVPVTTCECERSVSALRRMKTWLRSTMINERLNGLAQMHINDDIKCDVEEVINTFARQNPTRMQFLDILEDKETDA
ncbi:52 kDa repressor of the inhibitor of the protein kinase-like [Xenia sp. Carnegie-2017]|uniref:52 kDa repressor of the inhibitor of the protein kinase-like n=1 Tax=Xenia sp. Carnegie-2017 TaxID=2897299 RepID=UPI001F035D17|nr:52 kDa repressor of the inhibitor of the protein kinase-like [Xenia sp. Carnegie-2017]